jgi:MSHA biogenesis protein MshJ
MAERWQQLSEKFAQLSEREKWLIALCGAVGIFLLGLTLFIEPAIKQYETSKARYDADVRTISRLENENVALQAQLKRDPDREIDKKLKQLMEQSQSLSEELSSMVNSLIAPSQMAQLLEEVLQSSTKLELVSLSSLQPETLVPQNTVNGIETEGFFLHPVRIELTGQYFDILDYLELLESMPMQYFWRSYQYQVEEYPQARLIMEVYTLSSRQEFIGG